MASRRQHQPWKAAGTDTEAQTSVDEVVRRTGWVFNNRTGDELDLAAFVRTGDDETLAYLQALGLDDRPADEQTLVEIGSGIGRMTASFSRMFRSVVACDLDAAFLERCRQTVAQFGRPERLRTVHVFDGRTLLVDEGSADLVFSYITLQHCHREDALALTAEAIRAARPGGRIALNYRTWTPADAVLFPAGAVVRRLWRVPVLGRMLSRARFSTRLGWQANRLAPDAVVPAFADRLQDIRLVRSPRRSAFTLAASVEQTTFEGVHPSHWWLVATVR